jgi:hypothetical protein
MTLLFLLISYDSLPPLPDLSQLYFPEPALWVQPVERSIEAYGYLGDLRGLYLSTVIPNLQLAGFYSQNNEWDSTETGKGRLSYKLQFPGIWVEPRVTGFQLRRDDEYRFVKPGLDIVGFPSFAVIPLSIDYHYWEINQGSASEGEATISLIFDKTRYLPCFTARSLYLDERLNTILSGQIHIQNVHLLVSSPVTGGLSPLFGITYKKPFIDIGVQIQTGITYNLLSEYFKDDVPIQFRTSVPNETLKVSVDFDAGFDMHDHSVRLLCSYKDWHHRLTPGEDFQISHIKETQEINATLQFNNSLRQTFGDISNVFVLSYNWSDSTIAFLPEYTVIDTLQLRLGPFEIAADIRYVSEREGIEQTLSRYYIINTDFGIRVYWLKPYIAVHNTTDQRDEIYDGYFLAGRQYAGGLHVEARF